MSLPIEKSLSDELAREVARRRTFAIISHPDAGKTTLTEKLLLYAGAVHLAGAVQAAHDTGEARIRAPMPGLVIDIPMEVGASVERGQTVIVLEAMKMENDLASPKTGVIKDIKVNKGQSVNQGDVLVVIGGE